MTETMTDLVNILLISTTYRGRMTDAKAQINYLVLGRAIVKYLDSDFKPKNRRTFVGVTKCLNENDEFSDLKIGSVRNFVGQFKNTIEWLRGGRKEKDLIEGRINAKKGHSYRAMLRLGIDCMKEDNIMSLEKALSLVEKEENNNLFQGELNGCSDFQNLLQMASDDPESFVKLFIDQKKELNECLDELTDRQPIDRVNAKLIIENESLKEEVKSLKSVVTKVGVLVAGY